MITKLEVKAFEIASQPGLDPITVYYQDIAPGKGTMTLICYGCAWTMYWGATGKESVLRFFATCDNGYLVTKFGINPTLKQSKRDHAYLSKIIDAVKVALEEVTW
jgi:hypothetical protein